jgi:molybdopterin molybdotransferase
MKNFLQLISSEEAYRRLGETPPLATETIDARTALGRVAAREVRSEDDVPHFFRSNMDGFAVRAEDTAGAAEGSSVRLRVVGQVAMGKAAVDIVGPGEAVRISTGGMMPSGADAVVIVENTEESGDARILVRSAVAKGQNTIAAGEDLKRDELVFSPGRRFKPGDVGALTGVGLGKVVVYRTPRVGIMATGDEIVEPGEPLGPGQVRNVNQYLLAAFARRDGAILNDYGVVGDDPDDLSFAVRRAADENDVVFVSGGSSKGPKDLTRGAIESVPGAEIVFHGIAIAPGKPTIFARNADTAFMGLPGNPAAAAVVFTLFGSTLVRVLGGEPLARILLTRPVLGARLADSVRSTAGREDYLRVRLDESDGLPTAVPLQGKSVAISTIARADGLLRIPQSTEGLERGERVDILLI